MGFLDVIPLMGSGGHSSFLRPLLSLLIPVFSFNTIHVCPFRSLVAPRKTNTCKGFAFMLFPNLDESQLAAGIVDEKLLELGSIPVRLSFLVFGKRRLETFS